MKALFISHEGFSNSIFRSQVIEHCESLSSDGYEFDILTYEPHRKSYPVSVDNALEYRKSGKCKLTLKKCMLIYLPLSTLFNLILLAKHIIKLNNKRQYQFLHCRTEYTAFLALMLKQIHNVPVVYDCRGDSVDELKFAIAKFPSIYRLFLTVLLVPRQLLIRMIAIKYSTSIVFVSKALSKKLALNNEYKSYIIPCSAPSKYFYFSNDLRESFRSEYGIKRDEVLVVYSGSMVGYQSIEEFRWFYSKLLSNQNVKIIIATRDIQGAKKILSDLSNERLMFKSFDYKQMNSLYCGADYSLMIRSNMPLNNVASPTKFGEYCLAGLTVIHNNTVDQVIEVTKVLGNGFYIWKWPQGIRGIPVDNNREIIAKKAIKIYSRNIQNMKYMECYNFTVSG